MSIDKIDDSKPKCEFEEIKQSDIKKAEEEEKKMVN